jgi:hypothetical protein
MWSVTAVIPPTSLWPFNSRNAQKISNVSSAPKSDMCALQLLDRKGIFCALEAVSLSVRDDDLAQLRIDGWMRPVFSSANRSRHSKSASIVFTDGSC